MVDSRRFISHHSFNLNLTFYFLNSNMMKTTNDCCFLRYLHLLFNNQRPKHFVCWVFLFWYFHSTCHLNQDRQHSIQYTPLFHLRHSAGKWRWARATQKSVKFLLFSIITIVIIDITLSQIPFSTQKNLRIGLWLQRMLSCSYEHI